MWGDALLWFLTNWAVPVAGPPVALVGIRFVAGLPYFGMRSPAIRPPKLPSFIDSLDVVGWLFVSLATVATAFGEPRTTPMSALAAALGVAFLVGVVMLYCYTLHAQVEAKNAAVSTVSQPTLSQSPAPEWPSHEFRVIVLVVTLAGAGNAYGIRSDTLLKEGAPNGTPVHGDREPNAGAVEPGAATRH